MSQARLLTGDALTVLRTLPDGIVRCCVTSPPYWGLRDYGMPGQLGLEKTPEEYVGKLVEVFREVRRVLADDGTLWLNLGDSYTASGKSGDTRGGFNARYFGNGVPGKQAEAVGHLPERTMPDGLKPKDLVGIPWMVAFALRADGWYLRSDIIWHKPNPMPESVTDRPTKSHEYLFLLSKEPRYYYDADAIAEDVAGDPEASRNRWDTKDEEIPGRKPMKRTSRSGNKERKNGSERGCPEGTGSNVCGSIPWEGSTRNTRTVWTIATKPYAAAHFATFPEELARRCILAGSATPDTVLDPFSGSGTVAQVATGNGRAAIGIELNPAYQHLAEHRIGPLLIARPA